MEVLFSSPANRISLLLRDGGTYFLCQYVLHASGMSSGEM